PAIDSDTPVMRVEFENVQQKLTFTLQQVDSGHSHHTVATYNNTFHVNQIGLSEACSWLVPQDPSTSMTVINPTFIGIPQDVSLKFTTLSRVSTKTVTIEGESSWLFVLVA